MTRLLYLLAIFGLTSVVKAQSSVVAGELLVTTDTNLLKTERKAFQAGQSLEDVQKRFSDGRFSVHRWGERRLIILDRESGPLAKLTNRVSISKDIAQHLRNDLLLNVADLSPQTQSKLLPVSSNANVRPMPRPKRLALQSCLEVVVTLNGVERVVTLPSRDEASTQAKKELERLHTLDLAQGGSASPAPEATPPVPSRSEVNVNILGVIPENDVPEGMREVAQRLDEEQAALRSEADRIGETLRELIGTQGDELPSEPTTFDKLPESLKQRLGNSLTKSWQSFGFASEEAAKSALGNLGSLRTRTGYYLYECVRPGNPSADQPSVGTLRPITWTPGGRVPPQS